MPPRLSRPGPRHAILVFSTRPGDFCFFTQSTARHLSPGKKTTGKGTDSENTEPHQRHLPVSYAAFQPGPSNIPDAPLAIPSRWITSKIRAGDKLVLYRTKHRKPEFLYSAPRFLELPRNTIVPEICLLGRSNVGKSTIINALAGMSPSKTGTVNKTLAKKGLSDGVSGLAVTSSRAGCTQTINCYGFGPEPWVHINHCEKLDWTAPDEKGDGDVSREAIGGRSRSEVREDAKERARQRESHQNSLYIMDMPGYGHNSREEWGNEIVKYIQKRKMLKGAVLLIDAAAGFKDADRITLRLLRDAGVKTAVVLTKGNKAVLSFDPETHGEKENVTNDHPVVKVCAQIWEELRATEREAPHQDWTEGQGWVRDIFITAAHSNQDVRRKDGPSFGLSGLRTVLCYLAGLIKHPVPLSFRAQGQETPTQPSKIVSFSDIMWAPKTLPTSGQGLDQPAASNESKDPLKLAASSKDYRDPFDKAFGDMDILDKKSPRTQGRKGRKARVGTMRIGSSDPFAWANEAKSVDIQRPKMSKKLSSRGASKGPEILDSFDAVFTGGAVNAKSRPRKRRTSRASF